MTRGLEENDPEVGNAIGTFIDEAERLAEEHGPGSEAARRYWRLQWLGWFGQRAPAHRRRPRLPGPMPPLSMDPSIEVRNYLAAAEILDSPPPGEAVIAIPPEGSGSGRERAYIRIGLGDASWIGSFEIGYTKIGSISMMPDNKHLFVSAKGAGYIIDLKTRTLVEQIGTHFAFVWTDAARTLFMVDHNGMSLETFGGPAGSGKQTPSVPEDSERYCSKTSSSPAKRGGDRAGYVFRWNWRRGKFGSSMRGHCDPENIGTFVILRLPEPLSERSERSAA